jgi:xanthine dehydrogenase accessory factor
MARETGYAITLIDPRDAWASTERFPGVEIDRRWPDEALADAAIDRRSAIVALSHDAKLDEPALAAALRSDAFYIGALGSRRTQQRRRERLSEAGFAPDQLAVIHGPVGLDIGAVSPAEVAVSILAEMTQRLRQPAAPED